MDANKKVEVNEAFIAEWLTNYECLSDVKARAYKDRNAREILAEPWRSSLN